LNPRHRKFLAIGIAVAAVAAGVGGYLYLQRVPATCRSGQTSTICIDQPEQTDSLDPDVGFSTPDWAATQQVYQGLVNYNESNYTTFVGVLAKSWSVSVDPYTHLTDYTFVLRSAVHFSNGDPYNAYVQWYSLYRSLLMAQGPQFILEQNFFSTNFDPTNPLNYSSPASEVNSANATLVHDLNTWNFDAPSSAEIANMSKPNQSFQVLAPLELRLNLGYGYLASNYTYLNATLSAPNAYAVDPVWIDQHGGVEANAVNGYLSVNAMGTGPYLLSNYNPTGGGGYRLTPDSNYWGKAVAPSEPWNNMIQPANRSVQVIFQSSLDQTISDLKNGIVQTASFAYIGPSTVNELMGDSSLVVHPLKTVYGATSGSWWMYLNTTTAPFNNLSVREAVAHAINYSQIIDNAFGGYAEQWVGPVPPSYPYYNPAGLSPYSYNLPLAQSEIANSPCRANACAGIHLKYEYLSPGADWAETATFLANDLQQIGLSVTPVAIQLPELYQEQSGAKNGTCVSSTSANGGPFPLGQEFYTSDYISPDDWTQNDALSSGSANVCMSGFSNMSVDNWTYEAAATSSPAALTSLYTNITAALYNSYSEIWLVVPTSIAVYAANLHGVVQNPMGSAEPFTLSFNTDWIS
jgi:peptide/nickel transport system substrate-binding protein